MSCLVRGADGRARLLALVAACGDAELAPALPAARLADAVAVMDGDVARPRLGLDEDVYAGLLDTVTHVIHNAAQVSLMFFVSFNKCLRENCEGDKRERREI